MDRRIQDWIVFVAGGSGSDDRWMYGYDDFAWLFSKFIETPCFEDEVLK